MQRFPFTLARLGILLGAAGFMGTALGWDGASRQIHVEARIPYVISGGLGGLALVSVGTGLLLAHALLDAERTRTRERIAALTRDFEQIVAEVAIGATDDEHDPEGATTAFERAQILSLRAQAEAHLAELDHAERRLDAGTYGVCERCGEPIPAERLRARPTARHCVGCA